MNDDNATCLSSDFKIDIRIERRTLLDHYFFRERPDPLLRATNKFAAYHLYRFIILRRALGRNANPKDLKRYVAPFSLTIQATIPGRSRSLVKQAT